MSRPTQVLRDRTLDEVVGQLRDLGVAPGGVVLVHTSFRAIRPIAGGPDGFLEALRRAVGPEGTLVMPSWPDDAVAPYDPAGTPPAPDLGIVAERFRRLPGCRRTVHVQAFAALGPRAEEILGDPLPLPPHGPVSPVGRVRELDGQVLLAGVDHDADTTVHLAEVLAGVPYGIRHACGAVVDGAHLRIEYMENDCCCQRFRLVDGWLRDAGLQPEGELGNGWGRLARSRDIVETVLMRLREDPLIFLHPPERGCNECGRARSSIPVTLGPL